MKKSKSKKINFLLISLAAILLVSCARERARTDITLEMTDEDSVEAIIDQDLVTAGGTIVNLEEPEETSSASTVTYVDEVEMQKPVIVVPDESLKPKTSGEAEQKTIASVSEPLEAPGEGLIDVEGTKPAPVTDDAGIVEPAPITDSGEPMTTEELIKENKALIEAAGGTQEIAVASTDEIILPGDEEKVASTVGTEEVVFPDESAPTKKSDVQPAVVRPPGGGYYTKYTPLEKIPVYPKHTVKRGDNLWSISKKYGCTISELVAANNISRRSILSIGQILIIPVAKKTAVKPADESVKTDAAATTNNIASSAEPTPEPVTTTVKPAVEAPQVETEIYTVKKGDSYWKLARKYGITTKELMALNNTSSSLIKIGQKILVPKK